MASCRGCSSKTEPTRRRSNVRRRPRLAVPRLYPFRLNEYAFKQKRPQTTTASRNDLQGCWCLVMFQTRCGDHFTVASRIRPPKVTRSFTSRQARLVQFSVRCPAEREKPKTAPCLRRRIPPLPCHKLQRCSTKSVRCAASQFTSFPPK
jgi:hypothetical protein